MLSYIEVFGHLLPTMRGFTVSLIMLCGAIPATVAGHLADHFGRLRIVIAGAILCTKVAYLECAAFHLWLFLLRRALMGIGQGFALTNVGVYICETAPSRSISVVVFVIGYVSTWAVVGKIYASEIQPTKTRATTNLKATSGNFVSTFSYLLMMAFSFVTIANSLPIHLTKVRELACCIRNCDLPSKICLRRTFSFRRHRIVDTGCACYLHARDRRSIA